MQAWNTFSDWVASDAGWRIISTAIIPFVAIVVAGVIAAIIGTSATRRVLTHESSARQAAAIAAMIEVGRSATIWSGLAGGAQEHAEAEFNAADIRLRLLPFNGASAAADWATHELKQMRRDSANFSFQAEQSFVEYRDRLLEWQRRPGRARKLFALDLERFRYESQGADAELVEQQQRWAAEQAATAQDEGPTPGSPEVEASGQPVAAEPAIATSTIDSSDNDVLETRALYEPEPYEVGAPAEENEPATAPEPLAPTEAFAMPAANTPEPLVEPTARPAWTPPEDHLTEEPEEDGKDDETDAAEPADTSSTPETPSWRSLDADRD